jgi:predicted lipoprotein with Yx(FWY)xxD motif
VFPVLAMALAVGGAGCGAGGAQQGASGYQNGFHNVSVAPDATGRSLQLETRTVAGLGTIVTGPNGGTVYMSTKDKPGRSSCSGPCVRQWPPVTTDGEPRVGGGLDSAKLGHIQRADNALQVTYNGHPLYFFHEDDQEEGKTGGEGASHFGGRWYVLSPSGVPVQRRHPRGGS